MNIPGTEVAGGQSNITKGILYAVVAATLWGSPVASDNMFSRKNN